MTAEELARQEAMFALFKVQFAEMVGDFDRSGLSQGNMVAAIMTWIGDCCGSHSANSVDRIEEAGDRVRRTMVAAALAARARRRDDGRGL